MFHRLFTTTLVVCTTLTYIACGEEDMSCSPGDFKICNCAGENGSTGVRECNSKGEWGGCEECSDSEANSCVPGATQSCLCVEGGEGVQVCSESGDSWGECQGCGADGECDYTACTGDICEAPEDCCENTGCGSFFFDDSANYIENYCYPLCDPEAETDQCKCGDECINFGGGFATCLHTGEATINSLMMPVGSDLGTSIVVEATDVDYSAVLGEDTIDFNIFYAYWSEYTGEDDDETYRELIVRAEGLSGADGLWIFLLSIPEALMAAGVGEYPVYDEETDTVNFWAELYYGIMDSEYYLEELWLESLLDNAVLAIEATCDPCTAEVAECDVCQFSVDVLLLSMRTKINI